MGTKILHVVDHTYPHIDGYSVRTMEILSAQRALGLLPVVVSSPHHPGNGAAEELIQGISHFRTKTAFNRGLPLWHEWRAIAALRRVIRKIINRERPDVIHAHSPCTWGLAACQAARAARVPFVYEIRGLWEGDAASESVAVKYRLGRIVERRFVVSRADAVVSLSGKLLDEKCPPSVSRSQRFVVPNGIDLSQFDDGLPATDLRQSLNIPHGVPCIGYIGSLYGFEGTVDAISALSQVIKAVGPARLVIVGDGPEKTACVDKICKLGLQQSVIMVGRVPRDAIRDYYALVDVLVYPRRRNRTTELVTPLKPLEAIAMKKPIVCSDVGGLRELMRGIPVTFYKAGEVRALADICIDLLSCSEKRRSLAEAAHRQLSDNRSWRSVCSRYLELYTTVQTRALSRFRRKEPDPKVGDRDSTLSSPITQ